VAITTVNTGRHPGRYGADRSQSTTHGWVEQPTVPASAWRSGPPDSAWALVSQYAPAQIQLVDPDRTQSFSGWLRPAEEAPQSADTAALPQH